MQRCFTTLPVRLKAPRRSPKWPKLHENNPAQFQHLLDVNKLQQERKTPTDEAFLALSAKLKQFQDFQKKDVDAEHSVRLHWKTLQEANEIHRIPSFLKAELLQFVAAAGGDMKRENVQQWTICILTELFKSELGTGKKLAAQDLLISTLWQYIEREQSQMIVESWKSFASNSSNDAYLCNLTPDLFQVIVVAHATARSISQADFISSFIPQVRVRTRHFGFLDSGKFFLQHPECQVSKLTLHTKSKRWILQAELADLWSLSGSAGMAGRIRRWADRHLNDLILRTWETTRAACDDALAGKSTWLKVDWAFEDQWQENAFEEEEENRGKLKPAMSEDDSSLASKPSEKVAYLKGALFNQQVAASFLLSFLRCQMVEEATAVWNWLNTNQLVPSSFMWQSLIRGYSHIKRTSAIDLIHQQLKQGESQIPVQIYGALARAYIDLDRQPEALRVVTEMYAVSKDDKVPITVMNRLFQALLKKRMFNTAWSMLENVMVNDRQSLSIYTINIFLTHAVKFKPTMPHELDRVLKLMLDSNLPPDVATYSILLGNALNDGQLDQAERLLAEMAKQGVEPNERIFSQLIRSYTDRREPESLDKALQLLSQMEAARIHTNEYIYTALIVALVHTPNYKEKEEEVTGNKSHLGEWPDNLTRAHVLYNRMKARSLPPSSIVYNSLIKGHFALGDEGNVSEALRLFNELAKGSGAQSRKNRGPLPDSWYIVLSSLSELGMWSTAKKMVDQMWQSGFQPESAPLQRIIKQIQYSA